MSGIRDGRPVLLAVFTLPKSFDTYFGQHVTDVLIASDPDHFDAIVSSVDFAPDAVSPEAFVLSVVDLLEARAWYSDEVDWPFVRKNVLAQVDGMTTLEQTQGILIALIDTLGASGDNHSRVLLAGQSNYLVETSGFGFLLARNRVVQVYLGSPADLAGLEVGDTIEKVNGNPIGVGPQYPVDPIFLNTWGSSVDLIVHRGEPVEPITISISITSGPYGRVDHPAGKALVDGVTYLSMPLNVESSDAAAYVQSGRAVVSELAPNATCGWIVDLRLNMGGKLRAYGPDAWCRCCPMVHLLAGNCPTAPQPGSKTVMERSSMMVDHIRTTVPTPLQHLLTPQMRR